VVLIDTGAAVAKHLQKRLSTLDLLSDNKQLAEAKFWTNSEAANAKQVIETLWGKRVKVARL